MHRDLTIVICISLTVPLIVVFLSLLHPSPTPMSRTGSSKSRLLHITSYPFSFLLSHPILEAIFLTSDLRLSSLSVSLLWRRLVGW